MNEGFIQVREKIDHLFRRQAGQMVSTLTRIFGSENLDLAEDVVQEAMVKALRLWPFQGVPDNPTAWIIQVAKHRALDLLRRRSNLRGKKDQIEQWMLSALPLQDDFQALERTAMDDQLMMIFICCHPAVPWESRIAIALKTVGGFSVSEIARAFLCRETTIAQRLVRAKRRIREERLPFVMPTPAELPERLNPVLEVLYLMFNEGYAAHQGDRHIREDLCEEAIRLACLLTEHPLTRRPKVHALAALLLFQGSRLQARIDSEGKIRLLSEQDRSLWDRGMIRRALAHFERAAEGPELSSYHLEAEIASCHALAEGETEKDWSRILSLYNTLLDLYPSPVSALNRVVAVCMARGPEEAFRELEKIENRDLLEQYYLYHAVRADLYRRLGLQGRALESYRRALSLPLTEPIRQFLQGRLHGS